MKRSVNYTFLMLFLAAILTSQVYGRIFFVAPNGMSTNSGDQSSPWDLQTALTKNTVVMPGDTIYLRGGVYKGVFTSTLVGAVGLPVTVRSAPGEWAVIDGNQTITLASSIGTGGGTITFSPGANLPDPTVVMIDGEHLQLVNKVGNGYTINARGWNGTLPASHAAGALIRPVENILSVKGSDVVFGNFEVIDSKPQRILSTSGSNPVDFNRRFTGINVMAPRSKIINTIVHDTGQGIGFWVAAIDSEAYGNLLYNNGEQAPDRGHGHGIYTQNESGQKVIDDNILFGNFGGYGMHLYGSSSATLRGYSITGNIHFLNTWLVGGNAPSDDIKLYNNYLYGSGFKLGYGNQNNGTIVIQNNYVFAGLPAEIQWWNQVIMNGNRFYQNGDPQGIDSVIRQPAGVNALPNYQIDNNSYIFGKSFQDLPFYVNPGPSSSTYYNFEQWKGMGFDQNGSWQGATSANPAFVRPKGIDIFYRPNKYEAGRAHVVVYNYDGVPSVTLDLSKTGLSPGQGFEIRNGQNYAAPPILSGAYSSQFVTVYLSGLNVAQPWGNTTIRNPETNPYFCVFVIIPTTASTSPPPPGTDPTPTPTPPPTTTPTPIPTPTPTPKQKGRKNNP